MDAYRHSNNINQNNNNNNNYNAPQEGMYIADDKAVSKFSGYVLLDLFIGLLATALTTFLSSCLIYYVAGVNENLPTQASDTAYEVVFFIMIISGIILLIMPIIMNVRLKKTGVVSWGYYLTYCFVMGFFLSTMTVFIEPWIIGYALLISSLIFLVCYFVGFYSKVNLTPMGIMGFGLLAGVAFVSIPFLIFLIFFPQLYLWYEFVISIVIVISMVLLVTFESYRMKKQIMGRTLTKKDALLYSYTFYTDFINIFIRILYIISLSSGKSGRRR